MIKLKYGNTNTYIIPGAHGSLLIDTDYAGSLHAFYKALKRHDLKVCDIAYVLATHYHPDHMGLISEMMKLGIKLLLIDVQKDHVHFSDRIFARDGIPYEPIDESRAEVVSCAESGAFLRSIGINGVIVHTPSHSAGSVSLLLGDGSCFAGDLEPFEYVEAYDDDSSLKKDWDRIFAHHPGHIYFAHRPEIIIK